MMAENGARSWVRHDLIWIGTEDWAGVLSKRPDIAQHALATEWSRRARPLIVRRAAPGDPADDVPFGLPLPPAQGKLRIGGTLPAARIKAHAAPPRLADAVASVPSSWRDTVERLLAQNPGVQTFGSLAWQHLTGLPYLASGSDIDLLWRHIDSETTEKSLEEIAQIEREGPVRIDGEIVNAAGVAVQWRELASGASHIISKSVGGANLLPRETFLRSPQC